MGGLYAEAKLGLEVLMNKWHSEGWEHYLSIGGAVIGWTRGTGLMAGNNNVSVGIEKLGVRTFRHVEMAFNLTSILHPRIVAAAAKSPLWVDSGGGMARLHYAQFPDLPAASELATLGKNYKGMINLEKTVVVVGFGQVGPWGNSRWEVESYGMFSLDGCVEFAWVLGCIKFLISPLKSGEHYIGWVDAKTQDPVADTQVKSLYAENILKHAGIRVIEPELFEGYDPKKKIILQQVDKNMRPIEVASREEGLESQKLRQGAVLSIPKILHLNRWVAGQIPTGWDAKRYGIPADVAEAVDPITLFTLVSTAQALISAGITDPYEFYQYAHVLVTHFGHVDALAIATDPEFLYDHDMMDQVVAKKMNQAQLYWGHDYYLGRIAEEFWLWETVAEVLLIKVFACCTLHIPVRRLRCEALQESSRTHKYMQNVLSGKHTLVQVKDHSPYTAENEMNVDATLSVVLVMVQPECLRIWAMVDR
ncbi:unnamed protein product [Aphanomyces euteiches]